MTITVPVSASLPTPLYYQIKEQLRRRIIRGRLRPGTRLPTGRELEREYGVSSITVQQALRDLAADGLIVRRRGKGTFVTTPKIARPLLTGVGFSREMRKRGMTPGGRVLRFERTPAPEAARRALRLGARVPVLYLERLRTADGEPVALQWSCLPADRFKGLLSVDFNNGRSLYEHLESAYGVAVVAGSRAVEGVVANRRQARLLRIPQGSPLLRLEAVNADRRGRPVEFGVTLYRGDRYRFYVEF